VKREALEALVLLSTPMMPHLAEECWRVLGHQTLAAEAPWPKHDPSLIVSNTVIIPVQVNGKLRAELRLPKGTSKEDAEDFALKLEPVRKALDGKVPKKIVYVMDRIVNIVA
jgi:leucyl-tRNA synthetase